MKKIISLFIAMFMVMSLSVTSSAYYCFDDVSEDFFLTLSNLYLTEETKAGEIKYFGERITITDKDGNELSAEDYISSGCTVNYMNSFDVFESKIILVGDIDCNGHITAADARLVLRMCARLYPVSEIPDRYGAYDGNCSGTLESADAREILRAAAKIGNYELFKERIVDKVYSEEKYVPEYATNYGVAVILHCDYVNNPDCLMADFWGDAVNAVEVISENELYLKLHETTYDSAMQLFDELKNNNAVVLSFIDYDYGFIH